ncbi:hypothetical protein L198_05850 [Cryptococcus wingfieldii CBS 7118]|uniref:BTB domain-containing protein n=1 Tax=Cryptococcus wingfieldii CBS 7118 TaxID=1295528 RepID=A0A1E3IRY1_9TREE|nr:hypothetical protein L198_05850 [Cryptococcus wingfieldii CBS 7118]ODN91339.1 hypothetical protein L198_05850 [Cryptococcus wingfieldii CBS 7118]
MSTTDTEYAVSETWKATDGKSPSIKVISSDNVVFHVPEYLLRAHSAVLRALLEDIPPPTLSSSDDAPTPFEDPSRIFELTDSTLESASTLTFFLSVISGKDLDIALEEITTEDYVLTFYYAMALAKKWDCALATQVLRLWLMQLAEKGKAHAHIKPLDIFLIAAKYDLPDVAARVIAVYKVDQSCLTRPSSGRWAFLPSNKGFETQHFERSAWQETPGAYLHALALTPVSVDLNVKCDRCRNQGRDYYGEAQCSLNSGEFKAGFIQVSSSKRAVQFIEHLQVKYTKYE